MNDKPSKPAAELTPLVTTVVWMLCLTVGVLGLLLPYPRARAPSREAPPVTAERINVEITEDRSPAPLVSAAPPTTPAAVPEQAAPPPPPDAATPPEAPPLASVAAPGSAIAFAVPIDKPAKLVDARQAMTAGANDVATRPSPPVQHLVYGQGEGHQPAPEYPREAALARQEGTVIVRFTVTEDGSVSDAETIAPSPWPLLNQAALRAVHDHWRFRTGPVRSYEVSIQFQLKQRAQ